MKKLLIVPSILLIGFGLILTADASHPSQLDFTIEAPQKVVTLWQEYTVRIFAPDANVTIKINPVANKEFSYAEGHTRDGFYAKAFLIRDFEYRAGKFYNVTITVDTADQSLTKYTGFWVNYSTP